MDLKIKKSDNGVMKAKKQLMAYFKDPVPGTKIFIVENRLDTFHVNTLIETGEYAGTVVHWRLVIPENYPFQPANGWVLEDFYFEERHHHHCFRGDGICTDYLYNFSYMADSAKAFGGWTPGCTLTSLMIAMKQFFAEHDHHHSDTTAFRAEAQRVLERSKSYKCKECGATSDDLFDEKSGSTKKEVADTTVSPQYQRALRELICAVLHRSPLEDSDMLIGFPVDVKCFQNVIRQQYDPNRLITAFSAIQISPQNNDDKEKRIRQLKMANAQLFPEFLSLGAYCDDLSYRGSRFDNLTGVQLRSPLGNQYTHIIPIFLSQDHYERSESHLKTLISVICFGVDGSARSDFHPSMFVKVYPALMNKQIVSLLRCQTYDSEMLLTAFANLLRTYRYVCARYPEVQEINDKHVVEFCSEEKYRTKEWTNDLGELLFKMAAVDRAKNHVCTFENLGTKKVFMEEFFARQIFWVDKYCRQNGIYNFFDRFNSASVANTELLLNHFFAGSQVSLRLLLFNIECLKTFVTPDFDSLMDGNYGLLDKERIKAFRKSMEEIKQLSKLSDFFQRAGCPIHSAEAANRFIMKAYADAQRLGYYRKHY